MTVRGSEVSLNSLILSALGGCLVIIIGVMAYFMKDMSESMRSVREDVSAMKVEIKSQGGEQARLRSDVDDVRVVLYNHLVKDKN